MPRQALEKPAHALAPRSSYPPTCPAFGLSTARTFGEQTKAYKKGGEFAPTALETLAMSEA